MRLRLLLEDSVTASYGLAVDEALVLGVASGESPPTLRLYTYRSHCVLVGRFQSVDNEVHVDYCQTHGIDINRRPTGGGTILMGQDQLGIALAWPADRGAGYAEARSRMQTFSRGLTAALAALGVDTRFEGKNDLQVDGRKIAGLGLYCCPGGGLLFHASLLLDLDVALMLRVLKTPFEKLRERDISDVASRMTTLAGQVGPHRASLAEVRDAVATGYAATLGMESAAGDLDDRERADAGRLQAERYASESWVFQPGRKSHLCGRRRVRTQAGTLEVSVSAAGNVLQSIYLCGDFFASARAVAALEARLRWHSAELEALAATLDAFCAEHPGAMGALTPAELAEAIHSAARRAEAIRSRPPSVEPYGCFVRTETQP